MYSEKTIFHPGISLVFVSIRPISTAYWFCSIQFFLDWNVNKVLYIIVRATYG